MSATTQSRPYRQAIALQRLVLELASQRKDDPSPSGGGEVQPGEEPGAELRVKPAELADLVSAWDRLEDRKRILRGRPEPGRYSPGAPPKSKRARPSVLLGSAEEL